MVLIQVLDLSKKMQYAICNMQNTKYKIMKNNKKINL